MEAPGGLSEAVARQIAVVRASCYDPRVPFTVRRTREVFRGRVIRVVVQDVVLPNGRKAIWNIVEHPGAVTIVPLFENGDVLLVRQFRAAIGAWLYELPAGTLEPGEPPATTARRELIEETGYRCRTLRKVSEFYTVPGFCTEKMRLFVAGGLTPAHADGDEDEIIRPVRLPYRKAMAMVTSGKIRDAKSIVGLMMANGAGRGRR